MNKQNYQKLLSIRCNRSKYKFRENKFGVTWCIIYGLLGSNTSQKLEEIDKIIII